MSIRAKIFFLLLIFSVIAILNSCSQEQTWLIKFDFHGRTYSTSINEVKDELMVMARRQRRIITDLEWHKNYLFSKYLSEEIAVLEQINSDVVFRNIDNPVDDTAMRKKVLDSFRNNFRMQFAETLLPKITEQVLQTYYNDNKKAAVQELEGKIVQLTYEQLKPEIYEIVSEEYWQDYIKTWNEEMKKKYDVKYNEEGIHLLMKMEAEYLSKIIQPKSPNLALSKETRASSALSDENQAAMAFDGKQETAWIPAASGSSQWLALDLGEKKQFKKIVLYWSKDFPPAFTIQASDEGQLWKDIFLVNQSTGGGNEVNEILVERTEKRYVKILIEDSSYYTLREFEVY